MCIGEILWTCEDVYLMMFVIFSDTCTLGDFSWRCYFGENNEVWTICMWFDDLFGDDDFFIYTLK